MVAEQDCPPDQVQVEAAHAPEEPTGDAGVAPAGDLNVQPTGEPTGDLTPETPPEPWEVVPEQSIEGGVEEPGSAPAEETGPAPSGSTDTVNRSPTAGQPMAPTPGVAASFATTPSPAPRVSFVPGFPTLQPTATHLPTLTPQPTLTPVPTVTPVPTATLAGTATAIPSPTAQGTVITSGQTVTGSLAAGQKAHYSFAGTPGRTTTIRMTRTSSTLDPFVSLYQPTGALVASDDDSAGELNAQIIHQMAQSGWYHIVAEGIGSSNGSYTLSLTIS